MCSYLMCLGVITIHRFTLLNLFLEAVGIYLIGAYRRKEGLYVFLLPHPIEMHA